MTAVSTPRSAIAASSACSAGASGVVRALGRPRPRSAPDVADESGGPPGGSQAGLDEVRQVDAAGSTDRAENHHPIGRMAIPRRPQQAPERGAGWTSTGSGAGSPHSRWIAAKPAGSVSTTARATAVNSAPCAEAPGSAANRSAGTASCARRVTPEMASADGTPPSAGLRRPARPTSSAGCRGVVRGRNGLFAADCSHIPLREALYPAGRTPYPARCPQTAAQGHRTASNRLGRLRRPAGCGRVVTAVRFRAATASPRCCGTAAPPGWPGVPSALRDGASSMIPITYRGSSDGAIPAKVIQ